jgi:hypothetical protein
MSASGTRPCTGFSATVSLSVPACKSPRACGNGIHNSRRLGRRKVHRTGSWSCGQSNSVLTPGNQYQNKQYNSNQSTLKRCPYNHGETVSKEEVQATYPKRRSAFHIETVIPVGKPKKCVGGNRAGVPSLQSSPYLNVDLPQYSYS